jgi:hypothetical protein
MTCDSINRQKSTAVLRQICTSTRSMSLRCVEQTGGGGFAIRPDSTEHKIRHWVTATDNTISDSLVPPPSPRRPKRQGVSMSYDVAENNASSTRTATTGMPLPPDCTIFGPAVHVLALHPPGRHDNITVRVLKGPQTTASVPVSPARHSPSPVPAQRNTTFIPDNACATAGGSAASHGTRLCSVWQTPTLHWRVPRLWTGGKDTAATRWAAHCRHWAPACPLCAKSDGNGLNGRT